MSCRVPSANFKLKHLFLMVYGIYEFFLIRISMMTCSKVKMIVNDGNSIAHQEALARTFKFRVKFSFKP